MKITFNALMVSGSLLWTNFTTKPKKRRIYGSQKLRATLTLAVVDGDLVAPWNRAIELGRRWAAEEKIQINHELDC
jgi:hypothetical protein